MSYTPPSGSATNFTFGPGAYTPPIFNLTNFAFAPKPSTVASGFVSASFGTPSRVPPQTAQVTGFKPINFGTPRTARRVTTIGRVTQFGTASHAYPQTKVATGFVPITFGLPTLPPPQTGTAQGFAPTVFGTPSSPWPISLPANGFVTTTFGRPNITGFYAAGFRLPWFGRPAVFNAYGASTVGQTSRFGTPMLRFDRITYAVGFSSTAFTAPWGYTSALVAPNGIYCTTFPITPLRFGTPVAFAPVTKAATGVTTTTFGTPKSRYISVATGFSAPTSLGTHLAVTTGTVPSIASTVFGKPLATRPTIATGLYRGSPFGIPKLKGFSPYNTYGWRRTWFGTPRSTDNPNSVASGWECVSMGVASATIRNKALHTAPSCRFGKPLMTRVLP